MPQPSPRRRPPGSSPIPLPSSPLPKGASLGPPTSPPRFLVRRDAPPRRDGALRGRPGQPPFATLATLPGSPVPRVAPRHHCRYRPLSPRSLPFIRPVMFSGGGPVGRPAQLPHEVPGTALGSGTGRWNREKKPFLREARSVRPEPPPLREALLTADSHPALDRPVGNVGAPARSPRCSVQASVRPPARPGQRCPCLPLARGVLNPQERRRQALGTCGTSCAPTIPSDPPPAPAGPGPAGAVRTRGLCPPPLLPVRS